MKVNSRLVMIMTVIDCLTYPVDKDRIDTVGHLIKKITPELTPFLFS